MNVTYMMQISLRGRGCISRRGRPITRRQSNFSTSPQAQMATCQKRDLR